MCKTREKTCEINLYPSDGKLDTGLDLADQAAAGVEERPHLNSYDINLRLHDVFSGERVCKIQKAFVGNGNSNVQVDIH